MSKHQLEALLPPSSRPASPRINSESSSSTPLPAINSHPMQTRSKSGIHTPKPFSDNHCHSTSLLDDLEELTSYRVASYSLEWTKAMQDEIDALRMQGTWELMPPPVNKNVVDSKWIYKIKRNSDGTVARYKARLVAQGFSQKPGFDYSETFSPVVRHSTVHLDEEVYMKQPQGFEDPKQPQYVCKLRKSLYGLKQAPRAWNAKFTRYLPALGSSDAFIQEVIDDLSSVSELKDLGLLPYFLACSTPCKSYSQHLQYGIKFFPGPMQLSAFSNAYWAGDASTRRSTTWQSKKQGSVSHSSTEAEYRALANTAADVVWIRQVLADMHEFLPEPPLLHCDNLSALALSSNPVFHSRIKHLDIDFHFIRERVQHKDFHVQYIPTDDQVVDVFTKGLHGPVFSKHCLNLRLGRPAEIEGGCLAKG
ncbi:unnamed protein product [Prunus armeniaca]